MKFLPPLFKYIQPTDGLLYSDFYVPVLSPGPRFTKGRKS